ncbi:MAG TPA: CBS domain-containing protein [Candidatus Margulisiibacteriota bacterium]|nr:CBS domain-containing protein [Candidatus Margulisiibacteriota bacterium]
MKKLHDIMREGFLFAVRKDATVAEAARTMTERNVGIVVVLENDRLIGVFSERDAVRRVIDKGLDPAATVVGDVMTTELMVADEDDDYQVAMRTMDRAHIRHLPIVRKKQIISMLSIRDLLRVDMQRMDEELRFLSEYLYTVPPEVTRRGRK